jgi:membrane fusion protein (multidrug efflux system)
MSTPNPPASAPSNNGTRRRAFLILGAVVVVCGLAYLAYWLLYASNFESTDDAYVNGDVVQVTSEVPGTVIALHIDDTQTVTAGQPLLELDPADAEVAEANAEADLARAVRQVRGLFAQGDQLRAQIDQRRQALRTAEEDLKRRQGLLADGAISGEELSHARDNVTSMRAAVAAADEQLSQTVAQVDGTTIADHPQVLAAAAAVRNAALALRRTQLNAPVGGVVAKRSVQVGQRVAAGTPLLAVVPLDDVWIDANFKEVQLSRMRTGQPVTVHADLYGGGVDFHGRLAGLSAGSGSAFALLPAQNASGNWIKIVQRVPVRILLDPQELKNHPLRVGLSTTVRIDVRDVSGPLVATAVRNTPQPTQESVGDDPAVSARIARIIADNAGPQAPAKMRSQRSDSGPATHSDSRGETSSDDSARQRSVIGKSADKSADKSLASIAYLSPSSMPGLTLDTHMGAATQP